SAPITSNDNQHTRQLGGPGAQCVRPSGPLIVRRGRDHPLTLGRTLVGHHADPIGHVLGLLSFALPRRRDGCLLYVSDRGLAHLVLTRRGFGAITFGHVIVASLEPTPAG